MKQRKQQKQTKVAYQAMIVMPEEATVLLQAAASGDPNAIAIMRVMGAWLEQAITITDPSKTPLCLDCDTAFTAENLPPMAYAVLMPFMPGSGPDFIRPGKPQKRGNTLTTGICAGCVQRHGGAKLLEIAMHGWRTIVPNMQIIHAGHG
jgi:hypothetical protein